MTKILIADQEMQEREMLEALVLRQFPNQIRCRMAESGRRAVDVAALWGADILLMSVELPGMNGLEAARQILSQRPECRVIFLAGRKVFQHAYEALKLGATDYILKPVNAGELERAVRRALEQLEACRRLKTMAPAEKETGEDMISEKNSLLMEKVKQYLQHNYMMCNISLDSVSAILNLNASYFSAQFKRSFGINFVDYLTDLRIRAAKQLLEDPLHSAGEIAAMVGYESANYFARAFKKKTGMTPTEYRREAGEKKSETGA
jgi:YesN/AraC family two-component response regulator